MKIFDKLNLGSHAGLLVLNAPKSFEPEIAALTGVAVARSMRGIEEVAFALAFVTSQAEVDELAGPLAKKAKGDAVLWFGYPKGTSKRYPSKINRDHGWRALVDLGFDTVRLVAIDEDWSALRFRRVAFIKSRPRAK